MPSIVDVHGNPISSGDLRERQTAQVASLLHDFATHPSRGLTPGKLARILEAAERGDIQAQCDLFEDMEEKDGHIFAEMSKRKRALLGFPWDIEPPANASSVETRNAEEVKALLSGVEMEDVIFDVADAIGKAFACLEIEWHTVERKLVPKSIESRPQRWFQVAENTNDIRLRDHSVDGAELIPFGWLVHIHKARSGWLARSGLHRTLAWPYLFKNFAVRDLAEFLEIYGLPLRLGKYPNGSGKEEKATLLKAVMQIGHDAAGIIPEGMSIDFLEAAKGQKDPFEFMVDWCERTQSKVILGATLTSQTDQGSGAYALGSVHMEVMRDLVLSDVRQIRTAITKHLVYPVAALNLPGMTPERAPRFVFDTEQPEDIKLYSESLPALVDVGVQIPSRWASERLGIPEPQAGEAILQRTTSAAAPMETLRTALAVLRNGGVRDPDLAERLADRLEAETGAAVDRLIEPIKRLVDGAESLEAVRDGLAALYPQMDESAFAETLRIALAAANLGGRYEGLEDLG